MAGIQDFAVFEDDFFGGGTETTSGQGSPWVFTATGSPTATYPADVAGTNGRLLMTLTAGNEVQNGCLSFGDKLNFDIDLLEYVEFRAVMGQATFTSANQLVFGMGSEQVDDPTATTEHAFFRVLGATSTTQLYVETDDETNDNSLVDTGTTFINVEKKFRISFTHGKADVRFYVNDNRVAADTTFDMSNYSGGLQPYIQIQKTTGTTAGTAAFDYIKVVSRRAAL